MVRCPGQDTRYWTPEDIFDNPKSERLKAFIASIY
jgi:ABC-type histidine transport system ATPase subunit